MKSLYTLLRDHGDVLAGLIVGLLYAGLLASWLSYEDAALAAERRYRELERLLVIVIAAVDEGKSHDERGDGGASSRLTADRAADCGCGSAGHVPQSAFRPDGCAGRAGRQADPGDAARMIVQ